jgi:hypothetical protein
MQPALRSPDLSNRQQMSEWQRHFESIADAR